MMKIYQPLCPDITFRLAADLSPEDSEDSTVSSPSSSSSEEEEEAKLRTYEEGSPKLCPSPAGASLLPSTKNTKEIDNQDHVSNHHTTSLTPSPASATSPRGGPPHSEAPHWNRELNANQVTEYATTTAQPTPLGQTASQPFAPDTTTLAHGTKRRADDSVATCFPTPATARLSRAGDLVEAGGRENNVSDDDNDSVEDVSISHNVPMCPPSPSPLTPSSTASPRERMVVVVAREETGGGASGSSSDSEHCAANKTSGLRLQGMRRTTYQGPYTLACDVTPSPMQEQVTLANSVARAGSNGHGHVTAAATTPTTATPSSGLPSGHSSQLKVPRRPRKLPEIPRKHQGLATASSSHVRSIFDEIQEALIKEATRDEVFSPSPSSSSQERAAQQYPYIHKHMAHLFDKKRLLIGYASSGPACYAERSREASISSLSSRSRHVSTSSVHDVSSRSRHVSTSSAHDISSRSRHVSTSSAHDVSSRSRHVSTSSVASEAGAAASVEEEEEEGEGRGEVSVASCRAHHLPSPSSSPSSSSSLPMVCQQLPRRRKDSDDDGSRRRRHTSSSSICPLYQDMEVTHRGMHRFIPRHADELAIGIGDPIHVLREYDDLWCEGVNLRSGERGIFPAMYANDLTFLEDSDGDEEHWKFTMRFLGAVEVTSSSGDFALCQAINKVAQQGRVKTSSLCTLEINQYGIRMIDKSKEGHQSQKFSNFFALKNISFCGTHPNNNRYFAFITKHPREMRFACHVFHSDRSTHRARDALGNAFKRFYQEYMAFTHPTEDIWME